MTSPDFTAMLAFFKALANDTRLRIIGLLMERRRNVQELAATLALKEPTVSHHLAILAKVRLVDMQAQGNTHWYRLCEGELQRIGRSIFGRQKLAVATLPDRDAWEQHVLANFLDGEALKTIP